MRPSRTNIPPTVSTVLARELDGLAGVHAELAWNLAGFAGALA